MIGPARDLPAESEAWSAAEVLRWGFDAFGDGIEMATGFGIAGMVLLDMAIGVNPRVKVFTGDTEFLFPETYALIDRVEERYGLQVERLYSQLTADQQARIHGPALWERSPDQCCQLRKLAPLAAKLAQLRAWITAIRRDQTPQRASALKIEWDLRFQLVKINPIADWTEAMVWQYALAHQVSYNPLHDRHYPSIGCTHCTRSVQPGAEARSGRWVGFEKTECGLHADGRELSYGPVADPESVA